MYGRVGFDWLIPVRRRGSVVAGREMLRGKGGLDGSSTINFWCLRMGLFVTVFSLRFLEYVSCMPSDFHVTLQHLPNASARRLDLSGTTTGAL
jgi:hypothetical protein